MHARAFRGHHSVSGAWARSTDAGMEENVVRRVLFGYMASKSWYIEDLVQVLEHQTRTGSQLCSFITHRPCKQSQNASLGTPTPNSRPIVGYINAKAEPFTTYVNKREPLSVCEVA